MSLQAINLSLFSLCTLQVRYMPSDPSSSGIHERPMQHLSIHHQPLYGSNRSSHSPVNRIHSFHRHLREQQQRALLKNQTDDKAFLPDDFNNHKQLPNISSAVNDVSSCKVSSTSESSSRKGSGSSLAQSLNISFDEYYRGKASKDSNHEASPCDTKTDAIAKSNHTCGDNRVASTDKLSPIQCDPDPSTAAKVEPYLSSPSGYESSSSGNTDLPTNTQQPADPLSCRNLYPNSTILQIESNSSQSDSSSQQSEKSSSIGSLTDSCDVFLSVDTPSTEPDPHTKSSILKPTILHISEPILEPTQNQLKPPIYEAQCVNPSDVSNHVPKSVSFSLEESESSDSDVSQDSIILDDIESTESENKSQEENSLLLRPEFQGMKPTFV